jgi:hypothetical protein
MRSITKSSKNKNKKIISNWGQTPVLTAEQTILWLDGFRKLMFEVWKKNPRQIPSEKKILLKSWLKSDT